MNRFWRHGLSANTRKSYSRHFRRFCNFCESRGISGNGREEKPTEADLVFFAAHEASRGMSPGSIKSELSAIIANCVANGFGNPTLDALGNRLPHLRRVVRGISRLNSKARRTRKPMTTDKLSACMPHSKAATGSWYNAACFEAASTIGVYMLLRVGEMVSPKTTGHLPAKGLNVEDVEFLPSFEAPTRVEINIKNAKNDPFRNGCVLVVAANGSDTCPVQKMKQWLLVRGRNDGKGPLFKLNDGKLLTRHCLQRWLRKALDLAGYKGLEHSCHSLRAGGAESLIASGFDSSVVQVLGRWASDAFLSYLKITQATRRDASVAMSQLKKQDIDTMARRSKDVREMEFEFEA